MIVPKYPILIIDLSSVQIGVYDTLVMLKQTTREILNSGIFESFRIIAYDGKCYKLTNIRENGYNGFIKGWHPLLKGTCIKIEFALEEEKEMKFEKIKKLTFVKLSSNSYSSIVDIEKIRDRVSDSAGFEELIENLRSIR